MSYYCSYIKSELKDRFEELAKNHEASGFHQSFAWAKFQQEIGWESYKIGIFSDEKDELIGGAIVFEFNFSDGTSFLYIPEGPILDYSNEKKLDLQWTIFEIALHSIAKVNKKEKTTHIRIEPRIANCTEWFLEKFRKAPVNLQPRHTQVVDLQKSEEGILAQMAQKGRYNVRLAAKKGVEIEKVKELSAKEIDIFFSLYNQTVNRNQFEGKDKDFFLSYLKNCKEFSTFYQAKCGDGDVLAAAIIIEYGTRATYMYGASGNEHKELMAPYALHFEIMKHMQSKGLKEYDLWGIHRSVEDKEHDWHGITRFKKQFGGKQLDFIGAYDYVLQEDLYKKFIQKHES